MSEDRIVFDAEPLIAHAEDESGSATVEDYLEAVRGEMTGFVSCVTLTEVRYVLARKRSRAVADEYLEWLETIGVQPLPAMDTWNDAAEFVLEINPALGDAFALATARAVDGTLLIGGDDDFDPVTTVPIERFRNSAG